MDSCWCGHGRSAHIGGHQTGGSKCIAEGSQQCPCPIWQPMIQSIPRPRPRLMPDVSAEVAFEIARQEVLGG